MVGKGLISANAWVCHEPIAQVLLGTQLMGRGEGGGGVHAHLWEDSSTDCLGLVRVRDEGKQGSTHVTLQTDY